jgi:hypothetical protein
MATARSATQVAHYSLHSEDLDMNPLIIQSVPRNFYFPFECLLVTRASDAYCGIQLFLDKLALTASTSLWVGMCEKSVHRNKSRFVTVHFDHW